MLESISGLKTYIACALLIVIEVLAFFQILSPEVANSLEVFLGAAGLAALRAGVAKG